MRPTVGLNRCSLLIRRQRACRSRLVFSCGVLSDGWPGLEYYRQSAPYPPGVLLGREFRVPPSSRFNYPKTFLCRPYHHLLSDNCGSLLDEQVETFEDGFVVSDYAKMFEKKKPLNGNAGMWEWGATKLFGKAYPQVLGLICLIGRKGALLS